jgi:hypothetical protein
VVAGDRRVEEGFSGRDRVKKARGELCRGLKMSPGEAEADSEGQYT